MIDDKQVFQAIFDAFSEVLSQMTPEEIYELTIEPYRSLKQTKETE